MKIVISSGHGKYIRGASGSPVPPQLDEVDEARRVVDRVAEMWRSIDVDVTTFHDDTSHDQNTNLHTIVNFHNAQPPHDYDVSIHFNAYDGSAHGVECCYLTQEELAGYVADAIAAVGFTNRGPKYRSDLFFLQHTIAKSLLVETCFCDHTGDSTTYRENFDAVCSAIAQSIADEDIPIEPSEPGEPISGEHPTVAMGDTGDAVGELQAKLGVLNDDGDFGQITDTWVRAFQKACDLTADGIVGPKTWAEVDALFRRGLAGQQPLSPNLVEAIIDIAENSPISNYYWPDRGIPYPGFIPGMACCFAYALKLVENDAVAVMSMAAGDPYTDALAWYVNEFAAIGMNNKTAGIDTLRHLFVMMIGLGPRESSGKYCEGRDLSADNVQSDTAEAGLFQTSWNISNAHPAIFPMLDEFWNNPTGFLDVFQEECSATASNLDSYGSGAGIRYQFLSRFCPLFHVMVTAVGMRTLRQHWGPINRREVTLRTDADLMLKDVQTLMQQEV